MFVINLHDGVSGLYKTYLIDENDDLNIKLSKFEKHIKEDLLALYENDFLEFRIEVIDTKTKDIRNIIWRSKKGFLEACSIEKYVRHLINIKFGLRIMQMMKAFVNLRINYVYT